MVEALGGCRGDTRTSVRLVDDLEAGQRRAGHAASIPLAADLRRVVVERRQHPVDEVDPLRELPGSPRAVVVPPRPRPEPGTKRRSALRSGANAAATSGCSRSASPPHRRAPDPGRVAPRSPRRAATAAQEAAPPVRASSIRSRCGPAPIRSVASTRASRRPAPSRTVTVVPAVGEPSARSRRPASAAHRSTAPRRPGGIVPGGSGRRGGSSVGGRSAPRPDTQFIGPAGVPQVAVQVEPEPRAGRGCGCHGTPVSEPEPSHRARLIRWPPSRLGGRGPDHEMHRRRSVASRAAVARQGER